MIAEILVALGKGLRLPLLLIATLVAMAPATGAYAAVGQADKVTCMYPVWVGFGPVHLANELGYFKEEGIEVEEILDDDMPNGIAAMERGDIDCYLRTVGEYQGLGRTKDTQGTIIGTIDLSTGGDGWAADGAIKSVCDLKGKTIAVEPNLPARLIMQMALKKDCNLSIKDTKLTDIAAADAIGVFADPNVAAVGTYEPVLSQVVAAHAARGAHILASSKDYEDLILDVIFVHNDELQGQPAKIRQVSPRRLPCGRLLQHAPGRGDPDHRPALLDHRRTTSRRPCRTSATRPMPRRSS